jgi:hypothetical protein
MPIRKEDRHRYPADWSEIRKAILKRAGNRCEFCGAPNHQHIYRGDSERTQNTYMDESRQIFDDRTGELRGRVVDILDYDGYPVFVVLTIAHLDHTPEHCDHENLKALCQQCHNRHDAKMRVSGRWRRSHDERACGEFI